MESYIYLFRRIYDDSVCYIGQHNGKLRYYITGSTILRQQLEENGKEWFWSHYKKEIIEKGCFSAEELNKLEIYYIQKYNTFIGQNPAGLNLNRGGGTMSGFKLSRESIQKRTLSRQNFRHSAESRLKISIASQVQKPHSQDIVAKITSKTRGLKRSEDHCLRNGEIHSKSVIKLDIQTGSFIEKFSSIRKACASTSLNPKSYSAISAVCKRERLTAGGFKWLFEEDYLKQNI